MIHLYKSNGFNMVLDVNSGSVHVVDDCVYDVLSCMNEGKNAEETAEALSSKYAEQDITEAREEIQELADNGMLFTKDIYENAIDQFSNRPTVVKALCLHIAHDCNLACRYCFAEEGEYHGRRALMSLEVGKKALDFLIANSGSRRNLEVDFFGGEPLMNWDVVKQLVAYGREQEKLHNKNFRFTLTTNGVLLNDEVMEFCNKEMGNVVLSIDGRKEVHDYMRPFRNGLCCRRPPSGRPWLQTDLGGACCSTSDRGLRDPRGRPSGDFRTVRHSGKRDDQERKRRKRLQFLPFHDRSDRRTMCL